MCGDGVCGAKAVPAPADVTAACASAFLHACNASAQPCKTRFAYADATTARADATVAGRDVTAAPADITLARAKMTFAGAKAAVARAGISPARAVRSAVRGWQHGACGRGFAGLLFQTFSLGVLGNRADVFRHARWLPDAPCGNRRMACVKADDNRTSPP